MLRVPAWRGRCPHTAGTQTPGYPCLQVPAAGRIGGMRTDPLLQKFMPSHAKLPDLDSGLGFYRDGLGLGSNQ